MTFPTLALMFGIVRTLLLISLSASAVAQNACPNFVEFENGSILFGNLVMPKNGAILYVKPGGTVDVDVKGTATVGLGMDGNANLHYTYVIDRSGSTDGACGGQTILDCEKEAVLALHERIKDSGAATDYGVVGFDDTGVSETFANGSFITRDRGSEINDAVKSLTIGGGTDFSAALVAALNSITETSAGEKRIIFLSDGQNESSDQEGFNNALQALIDEGVIIDSFAVGDSSSCSGAQMELQRMADATGGQCIEVANAEDLEDALLLSLSSEILTLDITLNGNYLTRVIGPFDGPVSMDVEATATFLPEGEYEVCIEVIGDLRRQTDRFSEMTVSCCTWFSIKSSPYTPHQPQHVRNKRSKQSKSYGNDKGWYGGDSYASTEQKRSYQGYHGY